MSWAIARLPAKCGCCPTTVAPGEPVRTSDISGITTCGPCAFRLFDERPPAALFEVPVPVVPPPTRPRAAQPTLFGVDELAGQFRHADARVALERARAALAKGRS